MFCKTLCIVKDRLFLHNLEHNAASLLDPLDSSVSFGSMRTHPPSVSAISSHGSVAVCSVRQHLFESESV